MLRVGDEEGLIGLSPFITTGRRELWDLIRPRNQASLVSLRGGIGADTDGPGALTALAYTTKLDVLHTVEGFR